MELASGMHQEILFALPAEYIKIRQLIIIDYSEPTSNIFQITNQTNLITSDRLFLLLHTVKTRLMSTVSFV